MKFKIINVVYKYYYYNNVLRCDSPQVAGLNYNVFLMYSSLVHLSYMTVTTGYVMIKGSF